MAETSQSRAAALRPETRLACRCQRVPAGCAGCTSDHMQRAVCRPVSYAKSSLHYLQEFFMANRHCGDGSTLIVQVNPTLPPV